jgi:uncharacterized protein YqeY
MVGFIVLGVIVISLLRAVTEHYVENKKLVMSIKKQVEQDALNARKARDTEKTETLNAVKAAFQLMEVDNKTPNEADYIKVISKVIKQYTETAEAAGDGASRRQLFVKSMNSVALLEAYLPKALSIEDVKILINEVVKENNLELVKKNMGNIVKLTVSKASGQTDGKTVSSIVTELITAHGA